MEGGKDGGKKLNWKVTHALKTQGNTADSQEGGEDILFTQGLMHLRARASYTTHTRQIWERGKQNWYESWTRGTPRRRVPWVFFCSHTLDGMLEKLPPRNTQRPDKAPQESLSLVKGAGKGKPSKTESI